MLLLGDSLILNSLTSDLIDGSLTKVWRASQRRTDGTSIGDRLGGGGRRQCGWSADDRSFGSSKLRSRRGYCSLRGSSLLRSCWNRSCRNELIERGKWRLVAEQVRILSPDLLMIVLNEREIRHLHQLVQLSNLILSQLFDGVIGLLEFPSEVSTDGFANEKDEDGIEEDGTEAEGVLLEGSNARERSQRGL